ncbi:MAG: class I SAM-dependent methyltransferase [Spirochaetes bacterium]|nr:class I SAM-dependent methyltransferase [Spirochaetota bacterium]
MAHKWIDVVNEVRVVLDRIPIDFGGGCSLHKALVMAYLIKKFNLQNSIDIGVYRGRSLFPQAVAHKLGTGGVVYGVDPWSAVEALEKDNIPLRQKIDEFVKNADFDGIYNSVASLNTKYEYTAHCILIRKTSAQANIWFRENKVCFDLIHVDGNHDTGRVMDDIDLYLPLLNKGGFIILDDISWDSVKPAYTILEKKMSLLWKRTGSNDASDFAVFWNIKKPICNIFLKAELHMQIGKV